MKKKEKKIKSKNYNIIRQLISDESSKYSHNNKYSLRNDNSLVQLKENNTYKKHFKNLRFKHKNIIVKLQFNQIFLLRIFILMYLLSFTITQNIRNLDSRNIIYLTVNGLNFQSIINPEYEPDFIYLNDIETENYFGSIYIDKNGKNKVTLVLIIH